jgi:hypothetical protein
MSEWPKTEWVHTHNHDPLGPQPDPDMEKVEVIPADLGRELYEAAKAIRDPGFEDWNPPTAYAAEQRLDAALARYEEEVGS